MWRVCEDADGLALRSPLLDTRWRAGAELVASCARAPAHGAPSLSCSCGVYALADAAAAARYLVGRDEARTLHRVIGQVALWGKVVAGARGWRGSCAYPVRLWVPAGRPDGRRVAADAIAEALRAYGVEVDVVEALGWRGAARHVAQRASVA